MSIEDNKKLKFYIEASSIAQKLVDVIKQEINQALDGYNITYRQWLVLKVIHFEGANTPTNIADHISTDKPAITRITDHLVACSLLVRNRGLDDRRTIQLQLTDRGEHLVMEGLAVFEAVPELFKAKLTHKELKKVLFIEQSLLKK